MSAMADMSRAIRLVLEQHGPTLKQIPDDELNQYIQIVGALWFDLKDERDSRPPK